MMEKFKIYNLIGDVNDNLEADISRFITDAMLTPEAPVLIAINSPGGITDVGFSIYNKLKAMPNPVFTLITGCANSIANIIFMAAPYNRRFAFENTTFFVHTANLTVGRDSQLSVVRLEEKIADLTAINSNIFSILSLETRIYTEELTQIFIRQDGEAKFYSSDFEKYKIANIITKFDEIYTR